MEFSKFIRSRHSRALLIALTLAFIHGLIYVFLMPPWQHYDEPNHFEYVWLVAERGDLPEPGDYDQSMRREVAISMINHGFFKDLNFLPNLNTDNEPIWIGGYPQLSNPPLYYLLASVPLRLIPVGSVSRQLYLGRLVSLVFFLLSVLAAWGIVVELTPPCHPLRLMVPLTVALLPGYIDIMTSVNNDVGAISFFSLALWGIVRIARGRLALWTVLLTALVVLLSYFTKETAYIALPLFLIALWFSLFRRDRRWVAWAAFLASMVALAAAMLTWGDAALWYRSTAQTRDTRVRSDKAVLGSHALYLESSAQVTPSWLVPLFQPVPGATGKGLEGKSYTLGVWMWASRPVEASTPIVNDGKQAFFVTAPLGTEPAFFTVTATLSDDPVHRVWVSLSPLRTEAQDTVEVFYDGMVLAEGERPAEDLPRFDSLDGQSGTWGGVPFTNLIRNGSAESGWPRFRPWADRLGAKIFPDQTRPSLVLTYLLDWQGAGLFYRATSDRLFRTFWGLFGWGHVPLLGSRPYRFLLVLTLVGLAGAAVALWRKRARIHWDVLAVLALALGLIWGMAFVRGAIYLALPNPYLPVARYAYTAIIPTALLLGSGWMEILDILGRWLRLPEWGKASMYLLFLGGVALLAVFSIYSFYYRG